jgi:hypothetical protein
MNTPEPEPPDDGGAESTNKHRVQNCPFCGAAVGGAVAVQITSGAKPDFAVRCSNCDAQGPWGFTAKLAIELWNFGFQATRPAAGRRTRNESRPKKQKTKS